MPVLAQRLLPAGACVLPVLSNLAVLPAGRRKGIARALCTEMEAVARSWVEDYGGTTQLLLQVEAKNLVARTLYASMGFSDVWTEEDAPASQVVDGDLTRGRTTLIAMAKPLEAAAT